MILIDDTFEDMAVLIRETSRRIRFIDEYKSKHWHLAFYCENFAKKKKKKLKKKLLSINKETAVYM